MLQSNRRAHEIKVLLAGGKEIFREGLLRLLKEQPHIEVVSQCTSRQALAKVKETNPDVIIIDANPFTTDALIATKKISRLYPKTKIAVLTDEGNRQELFSVIEHGARGYLSKGISVDDLIKCIELIARGEIVITPLTSKKFPANPVFRRGTEKRWTSESKPPLSNRELEIVGLVANGLTNKEIARKLCIADNTSKVHIKNILSKLQLRNRQHLAAYAVEHGLATTVAEANSEPE